MVNLLYLRISVNFCIITKFIYARGTIFENKQIKTKCFILKMLKKGGRMKQINQSILLFAKCLLTGKFQQVLNLLLVS